MSKLALFGRFKEHFNGGLTLAVLVVAVSTFNYGFDNQGFSTAQAMDPFIRQFGVEQANGKYKLEAYWLSLYSSIIFIGQAIGVWVGSLISARWGRKVAIACMSVWVMIASAVIISSSSRWQILVGRTLFYIYLGMELAVIPVYQAEIVPAALRGYVVSTYQLALIFGGLIMNLICLGTKSIPNNNSWRIPFALFFTAPILVLAGLFFIPESPRWLLINDKREQALASLTRLREGKRTPEEIMLELESIEYNLREDWEQGSSKELFQGVNAKRTMIAVGTNFFQEIMGQQIVSKFGTLMVKSIGSPSPFLMGVIFAIANLVFVFLGMSGADRLGRRFLLLASAAMQCASLFALGSIGTYDYHAHKGLAIGAVIVLVTQTSGFSLGYAPLTNVVMTEVTSPRLKDASQRVAATVRVIANFAVGFSVPYLMDDLDLKLGFVFGPICFLGVVFTWFCVPECTGKTLETIDRMFHEGVPLRKFGSYKEESLDIYAAADADKKKPEVRLEDAGVV